MRMYTLKDANGHYLAADGYVEAEKTEKSVVKTTRHFQDAKFFLHSSYLLNGFDTVRVDITETVIRNVTNKNLTGI
ncbi:hypothetical protein VPHD249_0095 [Vibrio phage D249]|nr:hypothetical protein SIPHO036v1_90001 [Vibrio phage 70E38.1]QZI87995.1 hypothetical protein SIPHO041v1_p0084 [Vibrio phage 234P1]QZI88166.1 hypothetical protein SIPHO035v1_p0075 [Vibrio phage 234P7B]QZI88535.1 hypothetical protein SIPHO037v1_p0094 [Vibrio phage 70E35.2]QZI88720.1 hypothetical protein SIPHO039v1_p0091 [Vibrio phage 70E35.5a]QZI88903.1 hypothetical protein SIPHO040v1_p0090 [Vibrio phage 70E35.6]QZI89118.1 hypothetical protein SIPHO042v1_p0121 [Vibrio phage 70E37.1]QZI89350.